MKKDNEELMELEFEDELEEQEESEAFLLSEQELSQIKSILPAAPSKETIKLLLMKLPSQIGYIREKQLQYKKKIGELKILIKGKKTILEKKKSEIRQQEYQNYQLIQEKYNQKMEDFLRDLMESKEKNASLKKTYLQEMSKINKPEKPTQRELDDVAIIKTQDLQDEINEFEQELADYEYYFEYLKTQGDKYDNINMNVKAYRTILVEEMRNLREQ